MYTCRLDVLRKVVPHRDRANTAAFLEEVISYVLGLKKRLAEAEGVAEADLHVPLVDVQSVLEGGDIPESAAPGTVVGNPAASNGAVLRESESGAAAGQSAMLAQAGMQHMMAPQFRDGTMGAAAAAMGVDQKAMMAAQGMPTPSLNSNQVWRCAWQHSGACPTFHCAIVPSN